MLYAYCECRISGLKCLVKISKTAQKGKMAEKTEWAIWNGQHRDTDNIWDKTQIEDKHSHCQFVKSL